MDVVIARANDVRRPGPSSDEFKRTTKPADTVMTDRAIVGRPACGPNATATGLSIP
jgi:hypothetical protein